MTQDLGGTQPGSLLRVEPLELPWRAMDPFLFCMYHLDRYPSGDEQLGPQASLAGRDLGQDFEGKDGWRMYHGQKVPGFPAHPHRGFETVTIVRQGLVDHADSLGATARYGQGDVQWLTAGKGIVHSEMFPLVQREQPNPLEVFQIWLNLPKASKGAEPHFSMFWSGSIPKVVSRDSQGRATEVTLIAGGLGDVAPPAPPPDSWASRPDSDVAIWTLKLSPHAQYVLPAARPGTHRSLYFFQGPSLRAAGVDIPGNRRLSLRADAPVLLENGPEQSELLLLQGRPIAEPVAQYGPFVMTSADEIRQTFADYQRTQFGGWTWGSDAPVHPREEGRFARHDGKIERPS